MSNDNVNGGILYGTGIVDRGVMRRWGPPCG